MIIYNPEGTVTGTVLNMPLNPNQLHCVSKKNTSTFVCNFSKYKPIFCKFFNW